MILAFGSAAVFALGIVLQQRVVMDVPEAKEASAGLLFRLIQHPVCGWAESPRLALSKRE